jgi:mannitol-1-phosphate/altronate dehydrogenase
MEKEIKGRLEKLKDPQSEDFDELINLIGFEKAKKFADKLVWEQIQWDELPEHEKRARIAQNRADAAEERLKTYEETQQGQQKAQVAQQAMQVIDQEIKQVLEEGRKSGLSVADIPEATELIIDEMLAYLQYCDEQEKDGRPIRQAPPSHRDVLQKIQDRENIRSGAYIKRLSVEQLKSVLTKEQLSQLRQSEIEQLYAPTQPAGRNTTKARDEPFVRRPENKKVMSTNDFFKNMDSKYGV